MEDNIINTIAAILKNNTVKAPEDISVRIMEKIRNPSFSERFSFVFKPSLVPVYVSSIILIIGIFLVTQPRRVTVTFVLNSPEARTVGIAGDFNNWDFFETPLSRVNGHWKVSVKLKPGQYEYSFVINEEEWMPDPENKKIVESGFGGVNSVIEVTKI